MKSLLLPVFFLTALFCRAQDYTINWEITGDCDKTIAPKDKPGVTDFDEKNIGPQSTVLINLRYENSDFKKLSYRKKKANGSTEMTDLAPEKIGAGASLASFEIKISGQKMKIMNETEEVAYPYELVVDRRSGGTCKLVLGREGLKVEVKKETDRPTVSLNILQGVQMVPVRYTPLKIDTALIEKRNAIIALDCSRFPLTAQSAVWRKKKNGDLTRHLWVGDYVKIYLVNFNPYLYSAEISDTQLDVVYGVNTEVFNNSEEKKDSPLSAASSAKDSILETESKEKLIKYALAVESMELFIDKVKNNVHPNSALLEENKDTILNNLAKAGLRAGENIEALYQKIPADERPDYEKEKVLALRFGATRAALMSLTYTLEYSLAPIQIRSYDKFSFVLTINQNGKKIAEHEYTYLIHGGVKVDQSFGVAFHGIFDQEFGLKSFAGFDTVLARYPNGELIKVKLADGSMKDSISSITQVIKKEIIEAESPSKVSIGLSTLTHLYYRLGGFNIGPEIGVSVDLYPKQNIRYLVGAGLMFLDGRHRISFDAGCAFGKYDAFGNGQRFGTVLTGADAQPTLVKKTGSLLYLGISWNVPLVRKDTQEAKSE